MGSFEYPEYRKYVGIDRWFKIISEDEFEETYTIGSQVISETVKAAQYPEKLRIQDMLACLNEHWEIIDEIEYLKAKAASS